MSYFTEFEQAFLRFSKGQFTGKNDAFGRMPDTEKATILKATCFAEIRAIPNNTSNTFLAIIDQFKLYSQNQPISDEAFIALLLKIERPYHLTKPVAPDYGKYDEEQVQILIRDFIKKFLKEISLRSDTPKSLKRSIDARFFLIENKQQQTFNDVISASIRNKEFGWLFYERLVNLLDQNPSFDLSIMPAFGTKEFNAQDSRRQQWIIEIEKETKGLWLLVNANTLDANLILAFGLKYYNYYHPSKEYEHLIRKAADMGNEWAQFELVVNILLKSIPSMPVENLAQAKPILEKLTQSQNKWLAAMTIDYMQEHFEVFAPAAPTAAQRSVPFCLDNLRTTAASTPEPSVTPAAANSNSRSLPSNFVPTNLSLRRT